MQFFRNILAMILVAGALAACASTDINVPERPLPLPDTTSSISSGDLLIGPMDTISVRVFGVPEFDGDYQVDSDGAVSVPLVGDINAMGVTSAVLAERIESALASSYLKDPDVNVAIQKSFGKRVTVEGSVVRPDLYPIEGEMSLLQAVALAGGPSEAANPKKVVVFRTVAGERKAAAFNLEAIRAGEAQDPQIFGNDIVVVDGSEARRTYGEVIKSIPLLTLFLAF